eukprot:7356532-Prymnesium_polylepis.1
MEHMHRGSLHRTTEATNCNEVSSRSHAVLQVRGRPAERAHTHLCASRLPLPLASMHTSRS